MTGPEFCQSQDFDAGGPLLILLLRRHPSQKFRYPHRKQFRHP